MSNIQHTAPPELRLILLLIGTLPLVAMYIVWDLFKFFVFLLLIFEDIFHHLTYKNQI